ncbi:MAG: hypothetical protein AAGH41_03660 [Pseudomonadota bacterium]
MKTIQKTLALMLLAVAATGCASVQLDMADQGGRASSVVSNPEREQLAAALHHLEQHPWSEADASGDGLVTMIFGGGAPSPRALAEGYLGSVDDDPESAALAVRQDMEETLSAAWQVASAGRAASQASQPVKSDLRKVEAAIKEIRQCRLVFAETMGMLAKRDGTVDRQEIRSMKGEFNQAIAELGRTADALSSRLREKPRSSFAEGDAGDTAATR